MTQIVVVSNPSWIAAETTIDKGNYYQVSTFGVNKHTTCTINDVHIDTSKVIERSKYGFYECRVAKNKLLLRQTKFKPDNETLTISLSAAVLVTGILLAFGK